MSGGHFDYRQYVIDEIADSIENTLKDTEKPRPPLVKRTWISVKKQVGENSYTYPYEYHRRLYGYTDLKKAEKILMQEPDMYKKNGRIYSHLDAWEDKDGKLHDPEFTITLCEAEEYEEGHEECYYGEAFTTETLAEFRNAVAVLRKAAIYAQRVDWLLSGDDGEEHFHKRLKEDLETLQQ